MIYFLEKIRTPNNKLSNSTKIINSTLIFLLGITLGIFSKWLDNLSLNNSIWSHSILDILDLANVFSLLGIWILIAVCISIYSTSPFRASINVFLFFTGMCTSYHIYTIIFSGFNPLSYMIIWYSITLISPFISFICWYAKGDGLIPFIIKVCILTIMILCSFAIGFWYFDFISILDTVFFITIVIILYDTAKNSLFSVSCSIILSYLIRFFI